jgi:polysaccharide biosynthesis transport protein
MMTPGPYIRRNELARVRPTAVAEPEVYFRPPQRHDGFEVLYKLWRRRGLIALTIGVTFALGLVMVSILTPRYAAEAQIMVGATTPKVANIESVLAGMTANVETVQSEGYVLQSRELAASVANRLALDKDPEFNPFLRDQSLVSYIIGSIKYGAKSAARWLVSGSDNRRGGGGRSEQDAAEIERQAVISSLLAHITVIPLNRSHVLSISAESENPLLAMRIANTLAEVYLENQLTRKTGAAEAATTVLDKQIQDLRQRVEASERAVEEYRRDKGLYQARATTVTEQQLAELNSQLILAESSRAEVDARLRQAEGARNNPDAIGSLPAVVNAPLISNLREKRIDLERQAAELSSIYGKKHPRMQDLQAQLNDVRNSLKGEISNVVAALKHESDAARARVGALRGNLAAIKREMDGSSVEAIKLRELEREAEANRTILQNFLERSKETRAQTSMSEPDAKLISTAGFPLSPSYPPTNIILVVATIAGALGGLCLALMLEGFDRTFRTRQQVEEHTGFQTIAMVPTMKARESARSLNDPTSPFSESLRSLHMRLFLEGSGKAGKVVMFTSAAPNEGKSCIAVSLARLSARIGRRVVVVDCDWRRPVVHRYFNQQSSPGLADLLSGGAVPDEVVHQEWQSGAHAIFAGNVARIEDDPQRFGQLRLLLRTLTKHYDMVIVDSPPVLTGSEVLPLASIVDRIVYVVRWGSTPRVVAQDGLQQLLDAHGKVAGVVLSQVDAKRYRRYGIGPMAYPYGRPVQAV